jgi:hypothetical protein
MRCGKAFAVLMLPQPPSQIGGETNVKTGVALRPQHVHIEHRIRISRRDRVRRSLLRGRTHCLSRNAIGRRRTSARVLPRDPRKAKSFARHAPTHAFITAIRPRGAALRGRNTRAAAARSSDPPRLRNAGVKPWQWDSTKWLISGLRRVPAELISSRQAKVRNALTCDQRPVDA